MIETQRIEIGSIKELIQKLEQAQEYGYKNMYIDIDRSQTEEIDHDEDWDTDDDGEKYLVDFTETTIRDEIIRLSLDCDNVFFIKDILR